MNKTLYIPSNKQDLWQRAERTAVLQGHSGISDYILSLLERVVLTAEELKDVDELVNRRGGRWQKK